MPEMLGFVQENGQQLMSGAALVLLFAVLVNQLRLLGRMKKLQKNIDGLAEKVSAYPMSVMRPDAEEDAGKAEHAQAESKKNGRSEEDDSRLISAVLQEIFP